MWARVLGVVIGVWLMAAPAILGFAGRAADVARIVGPLAASAAAIAIGESMRAARWATVPLGVVLLAAPLFGGHSVAAFINSAASGAALVGIAFVRGTIRHRLGGGWSAAVRSR